MSIRRPPRCCTIFSRPRSRRNWYPPARTARSSRPRALSAPMRCRISICSMRPAMASRRRRSPISPGMPGTTRSVACGRQYSRQRAARLRTFRDPELAPPGFVATLAQAPRAAKLPWIATVLVCGVLATAASAWQQSRELEQLRELSSHLNALARLLPGAPPANPEQTVDSLTSSLYTLNSRIGELQAQIDVLREKAKTRSIDSDTAKKLEDYLRPFGSHRVVVSCVPGDPEAFTYANQITNILRNAGWDAHGPETTAIFGDAPAMGIRLFVRSGVAPDTAKVLLDAFSRFDIPYKSGTTSND